MMPSKLTVRRVRRLPKLPPRSADGHKGDFGRVLIVGGSVGMVGAPALAANAALRSGAGLVQMALPAPVQQTTASLAPGATSRPLPADRQGRLSATGRAELLGLIRTQDVIAVGPGMGQSRGLQTLIGGMLDAGMPTVLDADGLNNLAAMTDWPRRCHGAVVLTPHPGEMRRLCSPLSMRPSSSDRQAWADGLARACGAVIVLKGHHTVVSDPNRIYVNRTGNPGMATGGSGDVLTGVIAALMGQGLTAFDAAVLGTHVHGLAGDLAAKRLGQVGLIASDLLDTLPHAFVAIGTRNR